MDRTAALRLLDQLSAAELAAVARPSVAREVRMARRDAAVRAAVPLTAHLTKTAARAELARMLRRYRASADWCRDQYIAELSAEVGEARRVLHRILVLNDGVALGATQLRNICAGHRG